MPGIRDIGRISSSTNKSFSTGYDMLLKTRQQLSLPVTADGLFLTWPKLFLGYGGWRASCYVFEAVSINRIPSLLFSGFRLGKLSCVSSYRAWHKNQLHRKVQSELVQVWWCMQISLASSLPAWLSIRLVVIVIVILPCKLSSCLEQIIAVGSLKQNTNGCGFVLHQVLPHLSLLWFQFWFYLYFACLWQHWNKRKKGFTVCLLVKWIHTKFSFVFLHDTPCLLLI